MKPYLTAMLCILLVITAAAQNDSVPARPFALQQPYHPVFSLSAGDIEHLPFTNIMEVLNAMFPFVFSDAPNNTGYTFIVDGRILVNPNAINVSQIAVIDFYPVSFDLNNGYRSGRGTFVITTKLATGSSKGLVIRSQAGLLDPAKYSFAGWDNTPSPITGKDQIFTHQEVGYGLNKGGLLASGALSFTKSAVSPGYDQTSQTLVVKLNDPIDRIRFSGLASYDINDRLKIFGGLFVTDQNRKTDVSWQNNSVAAKSDFNRDPFYVSGNAGLVFKILPRIKNQFLVEYESTTLDEESYSINIFTPPAIPRFNELNGKDKTNFYNFSNSIQGVIRDQGTLSFGWELLMRYGQKKENREGTYTSGEVGGNITSINHYESKFKNRHFAVMPRLSLAISGKLMTTLGLTYASDKADFTGANAVDEVFPFAGIRYTLVNANRLFSSLQLHGTYGQTWNDEVYDPLDEYSYPRRWPSFGSPEKNKADNIIIGTDAGFVKDRVALSFNFYKGNYTPLVYVEIPAGTLIRYTEVERSGFSAGLKWNLINQQKFSARFSGLLFFEKQEFSDGSLNTPQQHNNNPFINAHLSRQWRSSLQLNLTAGKFFLQANGLLRFNDPHLVSIPGVGARQKEVNNHGLTFLIAGYKIQLNRSDLSKNIAVSLQARNLVPMKYAQGKISYSTRYLGIGAVVML
ncbi:MAG TPA: hypothetical protein VGD17_02815 [Chitinophagaceae bacterium]